MIRSPLDMALRESVKAETWLLVARAINTLLAAHDEPQRVKPQGMTITRRDGYTIIALREVRE